jgi:hypothetical protein
MTLGHHLTAAKPISPPPRPGAKALVIRITSARGKPHYDHARGRWAGW